MSKRECDIIKDLLPSYVDEICSEASKEWIEEHLKECEGCRALAERMKNTEISAKRLEQEQLEAGRKVIRQNLKRSLFSFGLSVLMFVGATVKVFVDTLRANLFPAASYIVPLFAEIALSFVCCKYAFSL